MPAREPLDIALPQFSQADLCEAAGITMPTANNWIQTGALRPADIAIRRSRKPRLFSLITIFHAKVTSEMVKWLGASPPKAAAIARRTTAAGHHWHLSIPQSLARGESPLDVFAVISWSDKCRDWDVWEDLPSDNVLRINLKTLAEKRGKPRPAERPFLLLPVTRYFVSVYEKCGAIVVASSKPGDV